MITVDDQTIIGGLLLGAGIVPLGMYLRRRALARKAERLRAWASRHYPEENIREIAARFALVLEAQINVPFERFTPQTRFLEDLGMDELEPLEVFLAIEEEFRLPEISASDAERMRVFDDVVRYLAGRVYDIERTSTGTLKRPFSRWVVGLLWTTWTLLMLVYVGRCTRDSFNGHSARVTAVKAHVDTVLRPALENYRRTHGRYPGHLDMLAGYRLDAQAKQLHFSYGVWPDGHYEIAFSPDTLLADTARWEYRSRYGDWSMDR